MGGMERCRHSFKALNQMIPENIRKRMSAEDRKSLSAPTNAETAAAMDAKSEKRLQADIANFLRLRDLWFDQDAMHKRRTGSVGTPDFLFPYTSKKGAVGMFIAWECKVGTGKLTESQERVRTAIVAQGGSWRLIRSIQDAQAHLRELAV